MLSTVLKSSIVHKVCNYSSKVVFFRSQPSSTTPVLVTLRETPFSDVIKDDGVLSKTLMWFDLESSSPGINLLMELKTAKMFKLVVLKVLWKRLMLAPLSFLLILHPKQFMFAVFMIDCSRKCGEATMLC